MAAEAIKPANGATKSPLAFSLRTLLLVVVIIAAVAGLLKQGQELREMRSVLEAHNLGHPGMSAEDFAIQVKKLIRRPGTG